MQDTSKRPRSYKIDVEVGWHQWVDAWRQQGAVDRLTEVSQFGLLFFLWCDADHGEHGVITHQYLVVFQDVFGGHGEDALRLTPFLSVVDREHQVAFECPDASLSELLVLRQYILSAFPYAGSPFAVAGDIMIIGDGLHAHLRQGVDHVLVEGDHLALPVAGGIFLSAHDDTVLSCQLCILDGKVGS